MTRIIYHQEPKTPSTSWPTAFAAVAITCATLTAMGMYGTAKRASMPTEAAIERIEMHQPLASEIPPDARKTIELYGTEQEIAALENWYGKDCGRKKCK